LKSKELVWTSFAKKKPTPEQSVEYKLEIMCKGHYVPSDELYTFIPEPKESQIGRIVAWRPWKEGPKYKKEDK
jgi:hypothetical protein